MTKFELPEIEVVLFGASSDVITTSSGYEGETGTADTNWQSMNSVHGGSDGDFPL